MRRDNTQNSTRGQTTPDFVLALGLFIIIVFYAAFTTPGMINAVTASNAAPHETADAATMRVTATLTDAGETGNTVRGDLHPVCTAAFFTGDTALDNGCGFTADTALTQLTGVNNDAGVTVYITDPNRVDAGGVTPANLTVNGKAYELHRSHRPERTADGTITETHPVTINENVYTLVVKTPQRPGNP